MLSDYNLLKIFSLLLITLLCTTCLDQLELQPTKGTEEGIVIRGELILGTPSILNVRIEKLYNFDIQSLAPIKAQSVTLRDEQGKRMDIPFRSSTLFQRVFKEGDSIQIKAGASYQIEVLMADDTRILSTYEELPVVSAEEVTLSFEVSSTTVQNIREEIRQVQTVQFFASTSINTAGEDSRYFWTAERTFRITDSLNLEGFRSKTCYVTINLDFDQLHLLDGTALETDEVTDFPLSRVILNYEFAEGYYYTTYRKALSKGAFNYYSRVKENIERDGNLFETPVGQLPSNLMNADNENDTNIYGYFAAYQQDTFRIYAAPREVGEPLKRCPPINFPCPDICCDCLFEKGSQLEKPDFWEE